ncbi:MAG: hypothetical protein ACRCWS_00820, partial [Propionibacteriaceae bacterium]
NQVRNAKLLESLAQQGTNLKAALDSMSEAIQKVRNEIVDRNRGGRYGMHGFIAEVAQEGIGNARSLINGGHKIHDWVNDNGPADLIRDGIPIQQKFVAAGGNFSLAAIAEHMQHYPDYIANGGRYQIPADQFDIVKTLHGMSIEDANRTLTKQTTPSIRDWEHVQQFLHNKHVPFESLEASDLTYQQVQVHEFRHAFADEEQSLRNTDQKRRLEAIQKHRPNLNEGAKATAGAAPVEGGTALAMAIIAKRKEGKKFQDFTAEDWAGIARASGNGALSGGIRGVSIYLLTNFTATPAAVASSLVTVSLGIAEQAHELRSGSINELEFLENSEALAVQTAVSALSSAIGQAIIPIPILGAVIGNTVGSVLYQATSGILEETETELVEAYLREEAQLAKRLDAEQQLLIAGLRQQMDAYLALMEQAFSPDLTAAFDGSIQLAEELGLSSSTILRDTEDISDYFLGWSAE